MATAQTEHVSPSPLPGTAAFGFAPRSSSGGHLAAVDRCSPRARRVRPLGNGEETAAERVYVAVGRSAEKGAALLAWTKRKFDCGKVGLVHVHQPSPTIPTLMGKIPARQAAESVVSAHRREELKETKKILLSYIRVCNRSQVQPSVFVIENENVQKGIIELINRHGIRKLVMGSPSENCVKVKKRSSKVSYTIRNAAPSCEIWFVHNGKHVWTREADEKPSLDLTVSELEPTKRFRPCLVDDIQRVPVISQGFHGNSSVAADNLLGDRNNVASRLETNEYALSSTSACSNQEAYPSSLPSPDEVKLSMETNIKEGQVPNVLRNEPMEAKENVYRSKEEASLAQTRDERLESEFLNAIKKVKIFEVASEQEIKLGEEIEAVIGILKTAQDQLLDQRNKVRIDLHNALEAISTIKDKAQEVEQDQKGVDEKLKFVQKSLTHLKLERYIVRQRRKEIACQHDWWKDCRGRPSKCNGFFGFPPSDLIEFSLSDVQMATCDFSDSFKIGEGGSSHFYKGELSGRTVLIKKLHLYDSQGQMEFQKEFNVLSKLKHPHLVSLIGACPEAWSLVYEYSPNGSLQDHLMRRAKFPTPLSWKVRTRIITEICSALHFLHSSNPEKIIHGDLSPEKVYLESDLSCKIGNITVFGLAPDAAPRCPSFRGQTEAKRAFPYTDPEYERTGKLTPKSDVYAVGIIVLQLITGKSPVGLAGEARRAILCGKLSSILDPAAGEWPATAASKLTEFGLRCSETNSRDRPELTTEVLRELELLLVPEERPVPPFFLCPIRQEIMNDPVVAADGYTYEREALQGWLENERETSPMTNLRLDHLTLTPNHALRFAIQDWLCRPS